MTDKDLSKPSPRELARYQKLDIPIHPEIKTKIENEREDMENLFYIYKEEVDTLKEKVNDYQSVVLCHLDNKSKTSIDCLDKILRKGCLGCTQRIDKTRDLIRKYKSQKTFF